jgi:hypothetical protein
VKTKNGGRTNHGFTGLGAVACRVGSTIGGVSVSARCWSPAGSLSGVSDESADRESSDCARADAE